MLPNSCTPAWWNVSNSDSTSVLMQLSDAFTRLQVSFKNHEHHPKVSPPEEAASWLPKVHVVISNLKTYLLGTFHGVSHQYMQEYVDEFVYWSNRRWWEAQIPMRLLQVVVDTRPLHASQSKCRDIIKFISLVLCLLRTTGSGKPAAPFPDARR